MGVKGLRLLPLYRVLQDLLIDIANPGFDIASHIEVSQSCD